MSEEEATTPAEVTSMEPSATSATEPTTPAAQPYTARLSEAPSKNTIPILLHPRIIASCQVSISKRGAFTIGISGGSVPEFLSTLPSSFEKAGIKPQWEKWHVFLADERCVASDHEDSNIKNITDQFLHQVPIPKEQIYSIDDGLNSKDSPMDIAEWYESTVFKPLMEKSNGKCDCLLLGFGPDGHTCSLFPNHPLLEENEKYVSALEDSPKPPPARITLTFKALNECFRNIVFCASGPGKHHILNELWDVDENRTTVVVMRDPAPFPCGMVRPKDGQVTWVVDKDALRGSEDEQKAAEVKEEDAPEETSAEDVAAE